MSVLVEKFNINSFGFDDVVDISQKVNRILLNSNIKDGIANICSKSVFSAIFLGKNEDFFKLNSFFDEYIKSKDNVADIKFYELLIKYKSYFFKNSIVLPVENSKILIDNQDGIYFVDFENDKKPKEIIVSIVY